MSWQGVSEFPARLFITQGRMAITVMFLCCISIIFFLAFFVLSGSWYNDSSISMLSQHCHGPNVNAAFTDNVVMISVISAIWYPIISSAITCSLNWPQAQWKDCNCHYMEWPIFFPLSLQWLISHGFQMCFLLIAAFSTWPSSFQFYLMHRNAILLLQSISLHFLIISCHRYLLQFLLTMLLMAVSHAWLPL